MSDSNLEKAPAPKARSYTERFSDMEDMVNKLIYASNFHTNTIADIVERMDTTLTRLNALDVMRNTINAVMKLAEKNLPPTLDNVALEISKMQAQFERDRIQADIDAKILSPADEILGDTNVITFESLPEIEFGHGTLASFQGETKTGLLGKKVGDVVGNVKILGVYSVNESTTKEPSNEPVGQDQRS